MTVALIILALLLAGTVPTAIAMAHKAGLIKGDLTVAQAVARLATRSAKDSEESAAERIRRKDLVISGLKVKLRGLRENLQSHPDPIVRGSIALDGIISLLSELQADDDSEPDPDSDNEAGPVPAGDGS